MNGFLGALENAGSRTGAIQSSGKNTATQDSESMNFKKFLFLEKGGSRLGRKDRWQRWNA
jgi:hypothetical protein